jgi:glyoxylase-like metal-dependent hydrolase (beta-lactamase superfamily II)
MQAQSAAVSLGNGIFIIDGYEYGIIGKTGAYVILEEQLTVIDTGASPSIPFLLEGLRSLRLSPTNIRYIVLTHIHLDHSGGAGLLLLACPNATIVVHPKGARHLAHPERLIEGAKTVFGDKFHKLYDPILPIPEDRISIKEAGEILAIGPGRTLHFIDTPGHANHHFSIYDPGSGGVFTGDTVGLNYHQVKADGVSLYLPVTSPNQFNPAATLKSLERIRSLGVSRIYFGHYGMSEEPEEAYSQLEYWLPVYIETAERALKEGYGEEEIRLRLRKRIEAYLTKRHIPLDHPVYEVVQLDLDASAKGLADYLQKK